MKTPKHAGIPTKQATIAGHLATDSCHDVQLPDSGEQRQLREASHVIAVWMWYILIIEKSPILLMAWATHVKIIELPSFASKGAAAA